MQGIRDSWFFTILQRIGAWLSLQWEGSAVGRWLTGQRPVSPNARWDRIRRGYGALFARMGLPERLTGSIFLRPALFAAAAVVLAPLLPTMAVLALVCAGFFSLFLHAGCEPERTAAASRPDLYVILFAGCYGYATLTSTTLRGSLFPGLLTILFVLFYFALSRSGMGREQCLRLMTGVLIAGVLVSLYGFVQKLFPSHFRNVWTDTDMFSSVTFRVYSTLENPNVLGEYLLLVIPLGAAMCLAERNRFKKILCAVACILMAICLVLTYSRGCYLGLLAAAAMFLVLLDLRFLVLGLVALALCPLYLPDSVLTRFTSIGNMGDTSTSYRVYIWLGTLEMLKDYWFCGIGPGTEAFNTVYPRYAYNAITAPHSHNLFLQITCDLGVAGLVVFLLVIVSWFRMIFTALRRETDRTARLLQIGAVSAITGFCVESMTDYTFYNYRVLLLFWAVLGLGVLFCRMGTPREDAA